MTYKVHKDTSMKEYAAWHAMKSRCNSPKATQYPDYGGRGIKVCERWETFDNFLVDMGFAPSRHHSLDRIDNDGNYEPDNCRWATTQQQNRNQRIRKDNKLRTKGVRLHSGGKYEPRIRVNRHLVYLGLYDTLEKAQAVRRKAEQRLWGGV